MESTVFRELGKQYGKGPIRILEEGVSTASLSLKLFGLFQKQFASMKYTASDPLSCLTYVQDSEGNIGIFTDSLLEQRDPLVQLHIKVRDMFSHRS